MVLKHESSVAHRNNFTAITSRIMDCGFDMESEIRGDLTIRPVLAPKIKLLKNIGSNKDELLPEENDGVAKLQAGPGKHIGWLVNDFEIAPTLSLDPTIDYLNGKQIAGVGHAHLLLVKQSEYKQMQEWHAGTEGVEKPLSRREIGGHGWYRLTKQTAANSTGPGFLITSPSFVGPNAVEFGVKYFMYFYLVNIDDSRLNDRIHLQPCGDLVTTAIFFE